MHFGISTIDTSLSSMASIVAVLKPASVYEVGDDVLCLGYNHFAYHLLELSWLFLLDLLFCSKNRWDSRACTFSLYVNSARFNGVKTFQKQIWLSSTFTATEPLSPQTFNPLCSVNLFFSCFSTTCAIHIYFIMASS